MEYTWHKITKFYQGGCNEFQIKVPSRMRLTKAEWDDILEWLGDNTVGGHNYGYRIHRRRLKAMSQRLKVVRYPAGLCAKLMDHGSNVTTTLRMI